MPSQVLTMTHATTIRYNIRPAQRNINPCTVIIAVTLLLLCSVALITRIQNLNKHQDWDILIFTQRWPNTACLEWEEQDPPNNCTLPKETNLWTIHGIWPTKIGTRGPIFCNSSWVFNATALDLIRDELNEYWVDVEKGHPRNSFWKHEWVKHGTCASVLEQLNTELKYFQQALTWSKEYNIRDVLNKTKVKPVEGTTGYSVEDIVDAVKDVLGKNPFVACIHDKKTSLPFLSEIRICFNKNLEIIDCDGIRAIDRGRKASQYNSILTNCPDGKLIEYPASVPPTNRQLEPLKPEHKLVNTYKIVMLLKWLTGGSYNSV